MDQGFAISLKHDFITQNKGSAENELFVAVLIMFLQDLEAACKILFDDFTPLHRDLIKEAFKTRLSGSAYWRNRAERQILVSSKVRLKRQIDQLKNELYNKWMGQVCEMANVRYSLIRNVAEKILANKLRLHKSRSTRETRYQTRLKKKRGVRIKFS